MEKPASEKDPAAVALGKRRQALMTPDERRAWAIAGAKATNALNAKRSPLERREIARKGVRTRRLRPAWMRKSMSNPPPLAPSSVADPPPGSPGEPPDPAELTALLETASDEAIARLAAVIRRPGV